MSPTNDAGDGRVPARTAAEDARPATSTQPIDEADPSSQIPSPRQPDMDENSLPTQSTLPGQEVFDNVELTANTVGEQIVLPLDTAKPQVSPDPFELFDGPGVDPWWRSHGWALIEARAATGIPFSADDIRLDGLGEPMHRNSWGSLFGAAARAGLIRAVGAGRSTRRSRAGGWRLLWVGTPAAARRGAA